MKQLSTRMGLGIILCGLLASPATAALITFNFTGDVDHVHSQLTSAFSPNASPSAMSGFVTVDSSTPGAGNYAISNFKVTI